jgi:hypothetical protein
MRISPFFLWYLLFSTWLGQVLVVLFSGLWITAAVASGAIAQPRLSVMSAVLAGGYAALKLARRLRDG